MSSEEQQEEKPAGVSLLASAAAKDDGNDNNGTIQKGAHVVLTGLSVSYLNGRTGVVVGDSHVATKGRFEIRLDSPYRSPATGKVTEQVLLIKRENVQLFKGKSQSCNGCLGSFESKRLLKCSKCRLVSYCSKECQLMDWKRKHKEDCRILRMARKSNSRGEDEYPLPEDPGDRAYALLHRGGRNIQKKDFDAAERDFRRLIEVEGFKALGAYSNLGCALMAQSRFLEAQKYLEIAVTLEPLEGRNELKTAYEMLGNAYMLSGNMDKAIVSIRRALREYPGDPVFQTRLDLFLKKK